MKKILAVVLGIVMVMSINSTSVIHAETDEVYETIYLAGGGGEGRGCGSNVDLEISSFVPWLKSYAFLISEEIYNSSDYYNKADNNLLTEEFTIEIEQYIDGKYVKNALVNFEYKEIGRDGKELLTFTEDISYCDVFEDNSPENFTSYFNENFDDLLAYQKRDNEINERLKESLTDEERETLKEEQRIVNQEYVTIASTMRSISYNATTVKYIINDGQGNQWMSDQVTIESFFRSGGTPVVKLSLVNNDEEPMEEEKTGDEEPQEENKLVEAKPEITEEIVNNDPKVVSEKTVVKDTPNTGIMNNGGLYMILGLGSIVAITVLFRKKKKSI